MVRNARRKLVTKTPEYATYVVRVCARGRPQSAKVTHSGHPLHERRISMTCSYCRYPNLDDEHRCRRCGRPLSDSYAMATSGALATVPQPVRRESPPVAPSPPAAYPPRQARLFYEKPTGKVIPFEALASPELEPELIEQPVKARTVTR